MTALRATIRVIIGQVFMPIIVFGLMGLLAPPGASAQDNQPLVANDDSAITAREIPVDIHVLSNDSYPEGQLSVVTVTTAPSHGTAAPDGNGTFTYTPNPDFVGSDSFEYKICDSAALPMCDTALVSIEVAIPVSVNVIPQKLNVKKNGVLPVVVFGSADLDVRRIDPASVRLEGVAPIRSNMKDIAAPGDPDEDIKSCPDGFKDLRLKFRAQEIVAALGEVNDGQEVVLHFSASLKEEFGEYLIMGEDKVLIIKKGKPKPPKPPKPPKK